MDLGRLRRLFVSVVLKWFPEQTQWLTQLWAGAELTDWIRLKPDVDRGSYDTAIGGLLGLGSPEAGALVWWL